MTLFHKTLVYLPMLLLRYYTFSPGLRLDGLLERPDELLVGRLGLLLAGLLQLLRLLLLRLLRLA